MPCRNLKVHNASVPGVGRTREYPLFFPHAGRPLYGVFHPAETVGGEDRVVVFCHSLGIEHMVTQRMEVLGARAAVQSGLSAFRFNSRGHGDSAGNLQDVTLAALVDDACAAADYARALSGANRIIWVGVRFGCLIAADAMGRRDDAAALALWEPVHKGEDYFRTAARTMALLRVAHGERPDQAIDDPLKSFEANDMLPVVGTYIYQPLYQTAHMADLGRALQQWRGDTLIAQVQQRSALSAKNERLRSAIQQRGGRVTVALVKPEPAWSMLPLSHPQWTSEALLAETKEWLRGLA